MDLAERLAALQETNEQPLPATSTHYSDEEAKAVFLERLAHGLQPDEAADGLGRTATWFRRRRSTKSTHYDRAFAASFEEIMDVSGDHRQALLERIRSASIKAALDGNVRAQEKWLMALDPEFAFLKPAQFTGDFNVDKLMIVMKDVPTPILQQVRQALEAKRELPDIEQ